MGKIIHIMEIFILKLNKIVSTLMHWLTFKYLINYYEVVHLLFKLQFQKSSEKILTISSTIILSQ